MNYLSPLAAGFTTTSVLLKNYFTPGETVLPYEERTYAEMLAVDPAVLKEEEEFSHSVEGERNFIEKFLKYTFKPFIKDKITPCIKINLLDHTDSVAKIAQKLSAALVCSAVFGLNPVFGVTFFIASSVAEKRLKKLAVHLENLGGLLQITAFAKLVLFSSPLQKAMYAVPLILEIKHVAIKAMARLNQA